VPASMQLALAIHDGIHETPPWSGLVGLLAAQGCPAMIVTRLPGNPPLVVATGDPAVRPGALAAGEEAALRQVARQGGTGEAGRRIVAFASGPAEAWLIADTRAAPERLDELLAGLAPHFASALRTLRVLEERRIALTANRRILARLDIGILTLAADGRVIGMGPHARAIVEAVAGIAVRRGRIALEDRALARDFAAALAACLAACRADPPPPPRAFTLAPPSGLELLLVPAPPVLAVATVAPAAIVYLHRPDACSPGGAVLPQRLRELFELAPLESEIAALLVQGLSIQEAGERLGITRNTARSYLQSLFAKTGVHRQAELVRLILRGIGTIG